MAEKTQNETVETAKKEIVRTTTMDKNHIPRTIKRIVRERDILKFDLAIQRNKVWTSEQKSLFIHSLIYGFPFPPAYAQDKGDGLLWMLDGKQRLSTVITYCLDEFALHKNTPDCFGEKIAGLKFSQLPKLFQETINDTYFTIYQMVNMTDAERDEMFLRLNKGTPLNKIEQTRAMYSDLIEQVESIAKMEFFTDHINVSSSRFADQELILQTAMILDKDYALKGIGSPQIQKYVQDLKDKKELLSEQIYNDFVKADEYLSQAVSEFTHAEIVQILKKANVPMIIVTALKAIEDKVDVTVFGDFLVDFYITNYKNETEYISAIQSGTGKKESVLKRLTELDKAYVKFVNKRMNLSGEEKIKSNKKQLEEAI
jgi:hypothetical protein